MNVEKYIERIGFKGDLSQDINCLKKLHWHHVMTIPFEALDVKFKITIELNFRRIYTKVVLQNRGGYCYELNFLFHTLLTELGFKSTLVSSRIFNKETYGPEVDHMSIVVKLKELWLADVGFGDLFLEPLKISSGIIQDDYFKTYMIEEVKHNQYLLTESLKINSVFHKKYIFDLKARTIHEFEDQNKFKQISSESFFVKNTICTLPTKHGRKTIFNDMFKQRNGDHVNERKIKGQEELMNILNDEFHIKL